MLREGVPLAGIGVVVGIAGALAATPLIQSWLYNVRRTDPATFVWVACGLVLAAAAASYLPARRAANVDPMLAMRGE